MPQLSLIVLGSTGSIGTQALDVVREHPARFSVTGLAAGGSQLGLLARQVLEFFPSVVAVAGSIPRDGQGKELRDAAAQVGADLVEGHEAVAQVAGSDPRATVLNGVTGGVGLAATLSALQAGSRLALANKESLVVGSSLVRAAVQYPGQIVPVDSEHSAIAQALLSGVHEKGLVSPVVTGRSELESLVLTASGGPFRGKTRRELTDVTVEQALDHPTWDMGPVVTINSSTLMNKGLELIEAAVLFAVPPTRITPVVHPQSIVHSMVTWQDGSTIVQASYPDMKVPIALGLDWPKHLPNVGVPLRWDEATQWSFEPVDEETFPALRMAQQALESSSTHPAVMNAANEACVQAFIDGRLPWVGIVDTVMEVMHRHEGIDSPSLADILEVQSWAVDQAAALVEGS